MTRRPQGRIKYPAVWAVMIAGLLVSYLGFHITLKLENRTLLSEQQNRTNLAVEALKKELEISNNTLSSIPRFFLASNEVSRDEFQRFTESELIAHPTIQALEWVPHVVDSQRENYRQRAVRDGLLHFDIKERNSHGKMVSAKQRAEYFPVYYVEPLNSNKSALGFDLGSSEQRLATLQRARQSGMTEATASISLVQKSKQQKGFLLVQAMANGFAIGVFRIGDLFESAIEPIRPLLTSLIIEITDITDPNKPERLHSSTDNSLAHPAESGQWRANQILHFAGRSWQISSFATTEFIQQHSARTHWMVLVTGIILTLLISSYLRTLMRRESKIRQLVAQRSKQLQASEKMNQAVVEHAVDAVITIDALGSIRLFSPSAEKMFGYSSEEATGQNVKMLMPEPYHSQHDGYLLHHQQTGEKHIIGIAREVSGQRKDGSIFPLNLAVGEAKINGDTLYIGTLTDLTELKQRQQDMRVFSDRLDLATRAGGIGVWDFDVVNGTLNWDDRMFKLYGISRDQFPGAYEAWHNALHPDDLERAEAELKEAIAGGEPFETEFRIIWPNGEQHHIQAYAEVLFDSNNRAQRMIGVNLDITDSKRSQQAMLQAKQAAENANRQKSAFLNTMSHELRTPLTVILGYLPLLKNLQQMPAPETIAQIAEDMALSGQHLLEMINDLLDISRIEAGEMQLHLEQIKIQPLIEEMLRKFSNQAQQKGLQLLSDGEDFNCQVDVRRLRQIFINLIGNALKFTPQGSIKISSSRNEDFATFIIADTGIGIAEADLPFVFDTFHQVDNTSTRNAGGSGLGLAITRRLVELHGGSIKVESTLGSGTRFTFTIKQQE